MTLLPPDINFKFKVQPDFALGYLERAPRPLRLRERVTEGLAAVQPDKLLDLNMPSQYIA